MCNIPYKVTDPAKINEYRQQYNDYHQQRIDELKAQGHDLWEHGYGNWKPLGMVPLPPDETGETLEPSPGGPPAPPRFPDNAPSYNFGDGGVGAMSYNWPSAPSIPIPTPTAKAVPTGGTDTDASNGKSGRMEGAARTYRRSVGVGGGGFGTGRGKRGLRNDLGVSTGTKTRAGLQVPG